MTFEGPTGGFGKWSQAGVPHRGWTCVDIEDLGSPDATCEMCERQEIRYIHFMEHPDFPEILKCGCVCAGHMEEDLEAARRRDDTMHSAAKRRRAWPSRKSWKTSPKGNLHISSDGYHITVFKKGESWSAVINKPATGYKRFARRSCPTQVAAQLATFDALSFLRTRH